MTMTREEAIAILEVSKHMATSGRLYNQAIDMAIEALQAEPTDTDLISRADAIKAVASITMSIHLSDVICDKLLALPSADATIGDYPNDLIGRSALMEYCSNQKSKSIDNNDIARFPSAEAVQRWIPVSERFPSESDDYLCTIPLDADETYTEVLTFHKGRFYEDDDEWGATYHDDVVAWMPLPKPYKGGDTE